MLVESTKYSEYPESHVHRKSSPETPPDPPRSDNSYDASHDRKDIP